MSEKPTHERLREIADRLHLIGGPGIGDVEFLRNLSAEFKKAEDYNVALLGDGHNPGPSVLFEEVQGEFVSMKDKAE